MNVEKIQLVFLNKIKEALEEINDPTIKITLLKKIASQSIDNALNKTEYTGLSSASVSAMFSGRGRAWAKIKKDSGTAWNILKSSLEIHGHNSRDLIDMYETTGFAWIRYSGTNKTHINFHARYNGSKNEEHFKVQIPIALINQIENLEGVPHRLGLEEGSLMEEAENKKEVLDIPVSKEELSSFGIQTLEELLDN